MGRNRRIRSPGPSTDCRLKCRMVNRSNHILKLLPLILVLLFTACSSDESGSQAPPTPSDNPPIPTVGNPQSTLPEQSDWLVADLVELRNFYPDLVGATPVLLDALNEAHALDFQLTSGRSALRKNGQMCYPDHLEFIHAGTGWHDLVRSTVSWPFVDLGTFGGSYYYLCTNATRWMFADVNCRMLGGHLASLTSLEENTFVCNAVQAESDSKYFIGLTDWGRTNNDWIWTSGEDFIYKNWSDGNPSNSDGEEFVEVTPSTQIWNDNSHVIAYTYVLERTSPLTALGTTEIPCATFDGGNHMFLGEVAGPTVTPYLQRNRYWDKIFQTTVGAGAIYTHEHSYLTGTSSTTGMSFGYSISSTVSADWGVVSAEITAEFHADFSQEMTVYSEDTYTDTYSNDPSDKIQILALWQLRERVYITDEYGNPWSDPKFELNGELPYLDQGTDVEYLQTIFFDAK